MLLIIIGEAIFGAVFYRMMILKKLNTYAFFSHVAFESNAGGRMGGGLLGHLSKLAKLVGTTCVSSKKNVR